MFAFRVVDIAALALEAFRMSRATSVRGRDQSSVRRPAMPVELIDCPGREAGLLERTNRRGVRTLAFRQSVAGRRKFRQRQLVQAIDLGGEVGRVR
jgi:hypothetical protein